MIYDARRALELLRAGCRLPDAEFREGQEEAIRAVFEGPGRSLVVQKTGWGKSFVYFIATKLLREAGRGPALLISPLLSLMRNQIAAAERMGVRARTIHSENRDDWEEVERAVARDEVDVILISPERLANERFRAGRRGPSSSSTTWWTPAGLSRSRRGCCGRAEAARSFRWSSPRRERAHEPTERRPSRRSN